MSMNKMDLLYGFMIGLLAAFAGSFLIVLLFTDYAYLEGLQVLKANDNIGKLLTLGAVLNLIVFFGLLKLNRELMARGVILATIVLTIITLFV